MNDIRTLDQQAITAAMEGDLAKAIGLNLRILKLNSRHLAALNRLGKCYFISRNFTKSRAFYRKTLRIDRFNSIARRSLKLLQIPSSLPQSDQEKIANRSDCTDFIEVPGKTKVVTLVRLNDQQSICRVKPGMPLDMQYRRHSVRLYGQKCYIGSLPDDLALRLIRLTNQGNAYTAYLHSISDHKICVFIKETIGSRRNHNQPSFPVSPKEADTDPDQ